MTATTAETACELLGIRHKDGSLRAPSYSSSKDSPETIREVRIAVAKGAELGCWPEEEEANG